jgi:hypothetical protein
MGYTRVIHTKGQAIAIEVKLATLPYLEWDQIVEPQAQVFVWGQEGGGKRGDGVVGRCNLKTFIEFDLCCFIRRLIRTCAFLLLLYEYLLSPLLKLRVAVTGFQPHWPPPFPWLKNRVYTQIGQGQRNRRNNKVRSRSMGCSWSWSAVRFPKLPSDASLEF